MGQKNKTYILNFRNGEKKEVKGSNIIAAMLAEGIVFFDIKPDLLTIEVDGEVHPIDRDLVERTEGNKKYLITWLGSKTEVAYGKNEADAFKRAGIGNGAMKVLNSIEEITE